MIKTNIGKMPLNDYLEIIAIQSGFDDYEDMRKKGYMVDMGQYETITKEMVRKAYKLGIAKLIENPNDGIVTCQIGDYWFYFDDTASEYETVADYIAHVPEETIVENIYYAIEDIGLYSSEDEYYYYLCVFKENKL